MRRASRGRTLWRPSPSWQTTTRWAPAGGLCLGRGLRVWWGLGATGMEHRHKRWFSNLILTRDLAGVAFASGQLWAAL